MAYVELDKDGNVTATFGCKQQPPEPPGYAEIADDDPRVMAFMNRPTPVPPEPTKAELLAQIADLTAKVNALP